MKGKKKGGMACGSCGQRRCKKEATAMMQPFLKTMMSTKGATNAGHEIECIL